MSDRDDVKRLAEAHAAYFSDHSGQDLASWVQQHWSPDIKISNGGSATIPLDQWVKAHSAGSGFDWVDCGIEVTNTIVDDDRFAFQAVITPSRSGSGSLPTDPIPALLVHKVANGKVVEMNEYIDASTIGTGTAS